MNKSQFLNKHFGGKWTYDQWVSWECDDGKRTVIRCSAGVDEFDNPLGPARYWMYENGKTPIEINFDNFRFCGKLLTCQTK